MISLWLGVSTAVAQEFIPLERFQGRNRDFPRVDNSVDGYLEAVERFATLTFGSGVGLQFPEFVQFRDEARATLDAVPVPSGSTSLLWVFDETLETWTREEAPFAPALSQRAQTNGRYVFTVGFAFSNVEYEDFNGSDTSRIVFPATTIPIPVDSVPSVAENVIVADFKLEQRVFSFVAQFGITDRLDLGILVPIVDSEFKGRAIDRFFLIQNGGRVPTTANADGTLNRVPGRPPVAPGEIGFDDFTDVRFPGLRYDRTDTGIGDVVLRGKYFAGSAGPLDVGGILGVSLPTGDEANLLGVGAVRFDPRLILSTVQSSFGAHVNLGFHADVDESDRNRLDYSVGGEWRPFGVTFATLLVDQVGRLEVSGDRKVEKFEIVPGVKLNPVSTVVLGFNGIIPLNDEGLTTEFTPNVVVDGTILF